jgi:hypothetical protein
MREKVHTIMGDLHPVINQPYIGLKPMIISTSVILHDAIQEDQEWLSSRKLPRTSRNLVGLSLSLHTSFENKPLKVF